MRHARETELCSVNARTTPPADWIQLGIWNAGGRKASRRLWESSTSFPSKSGRRHLPFLLKTFPAEYRTPLRRLEWHGGFLAALGTGCAGFHLSEASALTGRRCPQHRYS